ncbi:multidrug resistance protein fnx1 [Alternaria burnsii]|uniref:Efflux pump dotC n=1 Tax=Alternaria burnsii TaxID=1187904 RepID=A0A8H7B136_9PLEO|nr:multidrug resistance protein fnx1 [Alternaria burnsii]KAF7675292.1 multidrug resistance protein fnx1 [Alternaria burnsii]
MSATHDATAPAGNAHLDVNAPNKDHDITSPSSTDVSLTERDGIVQNGEKSIREAEAGANGAAAAPTAPGAQDGEHPQRTKLQIFLIMLSLAVAVLLVALDITIVTTALPTISAEFNSASGYTWIGSAYLIAQSAATPIWGKISDIFGRKPILLLTNAIFFVGSLLAGVSVNMDMLIASRVIQGIGGGGLITLVNIAISDLFSVRDRGQYFGIIGGVWALASSLGPVVGGLFTQKVSWRWCFYINLPFDGVAFLILLFFLDVKTPRTPLREGLKAVDWLGSLTMVGGVVMLLLGLEFGGISHPWDSATVLCLIIFGAVVIGIFFLIEWRISPYPLMPLDLFSKRSNLAALATCFFHAFVFISGNYFLPLYFQAVLGATPILSGVYLLPTALSLSFLSAFTGVFIKKTGQYLPMIWFGMILMTLGFGLFIDFDVNTSWAKIIVFQIIAGIGVGPNFQSPLIALQSLVPVIDADMLASKKRDIATATATFGFTRNLGSAISVVVGGVVFNNEMKSKQPQLATSLGPETAARFGGGSAGANVGLIQSLPDEQKAVARKAFADSLSTMWILYVAFAVVGLAVSLLITRNKLDKQHEETKTGIEAEKAKRLEREAERAERRKKRASKGSLPLDPEAQASDPDVSRDKETTA